MAKIPWLAFRNSIGTEHFDVQPEIWVVHAILFAENSLLQLQNGVCCLRKIFLHWLRKLRTIDPMYYHKIETLRDPGACHFRRCVIVRQQSSWLYVSLWFLGFYTRYLATKMCVDMQTGDHLGVWLVLCWVQMQLPFFSDHLKPAGLTG